jgi:hypothetical protein
MPSFLATPEFSRPVGQTVPPALRTHPRLPHITPEVL